MSRYVGVHGNSPDVYNMYLFARFLGEKVNKASGNKTLCEELGQNDTVSDDALAFQVESRFCVTGTLGSSYFLSANVSKHRGSIFIIVFLFLLFYM